MAEKALLLSIRPEYAKMIFEGRKRVELRRVRPSVKCGDLVLVYVSSPVKALVGFCEVIRVLEGLPSELWIQVRDTVGITRREFDVYYSGKAVGFGIVFRKTWTLPRPIKLPLLRRIWSHFHPPQGYQYLRISRVKRVRVLHGWGGKLVDRAGHLDVALQD